MLKIGEAVVAAALATALALPALSRSTTQTRRLSGLPVSKNFTGPSQVDRKKIFKLLYLKKKMYLARGLH